MNKLSEKFKLIQSPDIDRLEKFEKASWPVSERATRDQLTQRLIDFPEGIFILSVNDTDVAQISLSPKNIHDFNIASGFKAMRDLPVDKQSQELWVTNIAVRRGKKYRSKGYAKQLLSEVVTWAIQHNYHAVLAGVTCDDYKNAISKGLVDSIEEYMQKNLNPAFNTFKRVAENHNLPFAYSEPIANYWPEDETSQGYGVLVQIKLI